MDIEYQKDALRHYEDITSGRICDLQQRIKIRADHLRCRMLNAALIANPCKKRHSR